MIENMFTIPIVKYSLTDWATKKKRFLDLLDKQTLTMGEESVLSDYGDAYTLTAEHEMGLYATPKYLSTVRDILRDEMDQFAYDLQAKPVIVRAWFERAYKKMHHPPHTHGHGGWSAVLFLDYNPEHHTPTIFISPFNHFIDGSQLQYRPECKEGDLILFPSMLLHYTLPNTSNVRRTVCSFNLTVDMDNLPLSWTPDELDLNQ